jgi:hypothetical protein
MCGTRVGGNCGGGYVGPYPQTIKKFAGSGFDFPYETVVERNLGDFSVSSIAKSRRSNAHNQAPCNHVFDFFES